MSSLYINTQPIILHYYTTRDEYKHRNSPTTKYIVFPNEIVFNKHNKGNTKDIFSKAGTKYEPDIEYKEKTYYVKHMNLLPWTTIEEFKYIVASVIQCEYNNIIAIETLYKVDYVVDNQQSAFSSLDYNRVNNDIYNSQLVIGYKQYVVHLIKQNYTTNTPYDYKFYDRYLTITKYITSMPNYDKLTMDYVIKNKTCQNIEVYLLYKQPSDQQSETVGLAKRENKESKLITYPIDIVKLFNINSVNNNVNKIVIHDNALTTYNNEDREYQYVKTNKAINEPFKNTFSRFNCCSMYITHEIYPSVILSRIEFYKTGLVKCCFIINDPELEYDNIKSILASYYTDKFWRLFAKFNLDECVYDFDFNISNLVPIYGSLSFIYNLEGVNAKMFIELVNLSKQHIPETVYKTNSSIFISNYTTDSLECLHYFNYTNTFRPSLSDTTIKLDISSHGHVQCIDDNSLVLFFTRLYNIEDLVVNTALFIPMLTNGEYNNNHTKEKTNYDNLPVEQQIEKIRHKYQKIPTKKGIKKLNEIDPVLFGTRLVNSTDIRPYSALAQKKEQRVVAITKQEYDIIYNYQPDYTINIKNQSQPTQRLYLFCPWSKYPYLNFHHYHNQLCIPKCTTGINKKTQYLYCSNQLDAKGYKNNFSNETSKMIVYYSPLLMAGRKCFPPDELTNICENYLLYKLPITTDVYDYVKQHYKAQPCIIQRDNLNKQYILHTELSKGVNYALVIQSELDNGYYIVIDDENKPYIVNDNKYFNSFLMSNQIDKNIGYTLFDYIDSVFNIGVSKLYTSMTFNEILTLLVDRHKIKFVSFTPGQRSGNSQDVIIGVVYNGVFLMTPTIEYNQIISRFDNVRVNTVLDYAKLPTLNMFQPRYITKYYVEYRCSEGIGLTKREHANDLRHEPTNRVSLAEAVAGECFRPSEDHQPNDYTIKCIEYKGIDVLIEPITLGNIPTNKPLVYFDYEAFIQYFKMVSSKKVFIRQFQHIQHTQLIKHIINIYVFIMLTNNSQKSLSLDDFLTIPTITEQPTDIKFIGNDILWKKSIINKDDFIKVYNSTYTNMNDKEIINIVYNMLYDGMNIYNVNDNIQIAAKIITNNTM